MIIPKETIMLSLNLWIWLFNNPGRKKEDSPYWSEIYPMLNRCPLCKSLSGNCKDCPGLWNKKYFFRQRYISYESANDYFRLGELCFAGAYWKWRLHGEKKYSGFIASNIRRYAKKQGYL